jgi:hypothetical protein
MGKLAECWQIMYNFNVALKMGLTDPLKVLTMEDLVGNEDVMQVETHIRG